ncbi:MAG TPA: enoyl-CoA hydratase-related protein [Kofleriaceae bacterium]|nr:enoyl-CoA hydratase-related protein [Kofleriaceae bacterium]
MTAASATAAVLYEAASERGVGVVRLNRPDNRNSMTGELLDAFAVAIAAAQADSQLRCLVITGSGPCFSAGADFTSIIQRDSADGSAATPSAKSYAMYQPFLSVLDIAVPVIGALNGHTVGGGFGLALVCDVRIGAQGAKYGANFAKLGLHPGMAITMMLPRLVGVSRAAEMLYSGELLDGETAVNYGVLSRVVAAAEVLPAAMALATTIAQNAPLAVRSIKRTLNRGLADAARTAARDEAYAQAESLATADASEGIAALLAKRPPVFQGK